MANQNEIEINHTNLHKYLSCEYINSGQKHGTGCVIEIQFKEGVITPKDEDRLTEMMEREASLDDFDVSIPRNLTWAELVKRDVDWYKNKRVVSGCIREFDGNLYISGYGDYPADFPNFTIEETGIVTMKLVNGLYCRTTDDIQKIMWRVNSLHNDEVFEKVDEYSCIPPTPNDTCELCDDEECDGQCYVCSEGCGKTFNINEMGKCDDRDMCGPCAKLPENDNCECDMCSWRRRQDEEEAEEKEEEGECDCCCRNKPCGEIFCDCCGKSWRNDKKGEETCNCECSHCCRLQRDCRYSCDGEESEEESESEEEEDEDEVEEVRVPYYKPLRSFRGDEGKVLIDAMSPHIVMEERILDDMRMTRVMVNGNNRLDGLIAITEVGVRLMKLEKLIYITISKDVYVPDIVRRIFDRYTEVLGEQDENMSKTYSEGVYLDTINQATKHRANIADILVSHGVLPVPEEEYL